MYIRTCIYAYINIIEHSRFNGLITLFIRASQSVSIKTHSAWCYVQTVYHIQ